MAKRKLKKSVKNSLILIIIFGLLTFGGIKLYQELQWRQTFEFRLLQLEYSEYEVDRLIHYLDDDKLEYILTREKNSNIPLLISEEFFIFDNLDRYLDFKNENNDMEARLIVAMVNVNRDRDFYEEAIPVNITREHLMLLNKYHFLSEDYEPEDLVRVSSSFAFDNVYLIRRAYDAFRALSTEGRELGYTIIIVSGYRSFDTQRRLWENLRDARGAAHADSFAARPGHSEHQTGFAIDVTDFHDRNDSFGDTDAYIWMRANAHRFGFILRYDQETEDITGYSYEPWHFRYVGIETANRIIELGITFDEYYAFFLAN